MKSERKHTLLLIKSRNSIGFYGDKGGFLLCEGNKKSPESGLFYVVDSLNQSFNVKRRKPVTVNSLSLAAR